MQIKFVHSLRCKPISRSMADQLTETFQSNAAMPHV